MKDLLPQGVEQKDLLPTVLRVCGAVVLGYLSVVLLFAGLLALAWYLLPHVRAWVHLFIA